MKRCDEMNPTFDQTYEIKSLIGQGGMSKVYLAEHKRLHTRWAVKEVSKRQDAHFDFLAESNILKRLQHPMLPRIVDIFEDCNSVYIVEDFVEGITLENLLKKEKKVEEPVGLQWMLELCGALRYLHNQSPHPIIYRDMKPSNVMLQPDGSLKIIDFGIAREYKQESSGDTTYIGTKGYAAPEQFGKAQTDARTDIYALGVTMYHLLTGKSPYEPPYQFVPARQLNPELSHGTEYILNKCVQSEPSDRYQSVDELLDDLDHIYKFDRAYQKYIAVKRGRAVLLAVLLTASMGMIVGGRSMMAQEKNAAYNALLAQASVLCQTEPSAVLDVLTQAQELYADRPESFRQYAYALYLDGKYDDCQSYAEMALEQFPEDPALLVTKASCQFELGDYESAAENYYQGSLGEELDIDHLRDYAVCLGRLGRLDEAGSQLEKLEGLGANPDVTAYVQGEIAYAGGDYTAAESHFLSALEKTDSDMLLRRCYISLAETYRDGGDVIGNANAKEIDLIETALSLVQLQGNAVLYEMLGAAQYNAGSYETAANSFETVLSLGVQKSYLYVNAFTAWQAIEDYDRAAAVLKQMESVYPADYTPHALMATLLIMEENKKTQSARNYHAAYAEYQTAKELVTSSDDTTQLQQLAGLIAQLKSGGWL